MKKNKQYDMEIPTKLVKIIWTKEGDELESWVNSNTFDPKLKTVITVGLVVSEDEDMLCVSHTYSEDDDFCCTVNIPKKSIKKRKSFKHEIPKKFVKLVWLDHNSSIESWINEDEFEPMATKVLSIGMIVYEDDDIISITHSVKEDGMFFAPINIIKSCIKHYEEIKV